MATKGGADRKPLCKYGESCYRTNPQHLKQFRHPKRGEEEEDEEKPKLKKRRTGEKEKKIEEEKTKLKKDRTGEKGKKIEDFFGKAKGGGTGDAGGSSKQVEEPGSDVEEEEQTPEREDVSDEEAVEEEEEDMSEAPKSPVDVKENIKQKFLVDMPDDFYKFWEFCKSENPKSPQAALQDTLGFQLVGPFDILAGKHKGVTKNRNGKRPNFLIHWRYYYDPPEFQTVIRGDDETQFHLGYFRDDPKEEPAFVGANAAKVSGVITPRGDNLFAATKFYIEEKIKAKDTGPKKKDKLQDLLKKVTDMAKKEDFSLELKSKKMKDRDKKVVCKSFHMAGIVVPVDENEVGYREVPETPADLKRMFKKIADSKTDHERDLNFEPLQEIITYIQFANDECDYGEGLELGIDLFSYGGGVFHSTIMQLLPLAYQLLRRDPFEKIINAHLKNRRHDTRLSQLE